MVSILGVMSFGVLAVASSGEKKPSGAEPAVTSEAVAAGCTKDTDCKGDRVCDKGACVSATPARPTATAAPSPPAPTASANFKLPKQVPYAAGAKRLDTVLGVLQIVEIKPEWAYELRLAGRVIAKADAESEKDPRSLGPHPSIAAFFEDAGGHDQVVVIRWDGMGNACSGYGYSFLGLTKGKASILRDIPFCGGPEPTIRLYEGGGVALEVPAHTPNHGTGTIKAERWVFADGLAKKI